MGHLLRAVVPSRAAAACLRAVRVAARAQVERLSALVEGCSETLTIDAEERVKVINSTVSIESRIVNFFGMIETDMYGRLQTCSAQFASYRPRRNLIA